VDLFHQGSGNIGATNVGRVLGRRFGLLVFALDFAKGALPTAAGLRLVGVADPDAWGPVTGQALAVAAGLAAFLGHVFPVWLRFRGGKGVATGAGVVAVLLPGPFVAGLLVWVAVLCAAGYVSLASLAAAAALCVIRLGLDRRPLAPDNLPVTGFCLLVAALVFLRHRGNVSRLVQGRENRLKDSAAMQTLTRSVHVLALGLWFGTAIFFTFVVGLSLFGTFEALGRAEPRPAWFPLAPQFARHDPELDGPTEQGTRAAGAAVGALFPWYFLLQGACGLLALGTAVGLSRSHPGRIHRVRATVLLVALLTVLVGWPLELKVSGLRRPRYEAFDTFLQSPPAAEAKARAEALAARREFGMWHGFSLLLNLGTVVLVTAGMALTAQLPEAGRRPVAGGGRQEAGGESQPVAGPARA
jgi:acyl-phosphate glycerol 3-phosphate acyltransferase